MKRGLGAVPSFSAATSPSAIWSVPCKATLSTAERLRELMHIRTPARQASSTVERLTNASAAHEYSREVANAMNGPANFERPFARTLSRQANRYLRISDAMLTMRFSCDRFVSRSSLASPYRAARVSRTPRTPSNPPARCSKFPILRLPRESKSSRAHQRNKPSG